MAILNAAFEVNLSHSRYAAYTLALVTMRYLTEEGIYLLPGLLRCIEML